MNVCGNASILSLTADKAASRAGEVCLAQARHHPRLLQELAQTIFRGGIHGIEASSADVRPATGLLRCPGRLVIRDGLHTDAHYDMLVRLDRRTTQVADLPSDIEPILERLRWTKQTYLPSLIQALLSPWTSTTLATIRH
jgi:hypothetical protein